MTRFWIWVAGRPLVLPTAMLVVGTVAFLMFHEVVNGDWRCAVRRCVTVLDGKP